MEAASGASYKLQAASGKHGDDSAPAGHPPVWAPGAQRQRPNGNGGSELGRGIVVFVVTLGLLFGLSEGWEWVASRQAQVASYDNGNDNGGLRGGGKVLMADWVVSGAGDGSYNGAYSSAGTHNGETYYVISGGGRYLYYDNTPFSECWRLYTALTDNITGGYQTQEGVTPCVPDDTWYDDGAGAPPPVVTADTEPEDWASLDVPRGQLVTAEATENIGALRAYVQTSAGVVEVQGALYDAADDSLIAATRSSYAGTDAGWVTLAFDTPPEVTAAGDYYVMVWAASSAARVGYDVGSDAYTGLAGAGFDTWSDPQTFSAHVGWTYRVELLAAGLVGEIGGAYAVTGALAGDLAGAYAATCAVAGDLASAYQVDTPLGGCLRCAYGVECPLAGSLSGGYAVTQAVSGRLRSSYEVIRRVEGEVASAYQVEGGGGQGVLTAVLAHYLSEERIIT